MDFDVIVLGAGAAGMMCAATAAQRGRRVLLVEHAKVLAEKIRISGGGRCNFTNRDVGPANFISRNPHFCRSALARYTPRDFIAMLEKHRIAYHEKTLGQLFCDDSSKNIIDMLKSECDAGGVQWAMPVDIVSVTCNAETKRYTVSTSGGTFRAASVVVATGGLSIPKIGATPFGLRLAEQFGMPVVPPRPALVPLSAPPEWLERFGALAGTSFDSITRCVDVPKGERYPPFRESALITHRGLSGPAILQTSSYWQHGGGRGPISIDLMPGVDAAAWLTAQRGSQQSPGNLLSAVLPRRFASSFADLHGWTKPMSQTAKTALNDMARTLKDWQIQPSGTLGYAKAEVTLGGVDTAALSQQTFEARSVPGLYFVGEVVDVTGWLGGYNFQWAWASGHAAGVSV